MYDLNNINNLNMSNIYNDKIDTDEKVKLESLKLSIKKYTYKDNEYKIIRYDKGFLTDDLYTKIGLLRSVILNKNNEIIVFSPPKSESPDRFQKMYEPNECYAEEYIEGTMINLYYDKLLGDWNLATRSTVGAKITFYKHNIRDENLTFREMFLQTCDIDFNVLDKEICYSFVLQHKLNRIVKPIYDSTLYLVKMYKIENYNVKEVEMNEEDKKLFETKYNVRFPKVFNFDSYEKLQEDWASAKTSYKIMGIIVKHKDNGVRTKFRNLNYENVRRLRGNQPKLQYHYLCLRKEGKVKDYLHYYPENKHAFNEFRDMLHMITRILYTYYCQCYKNKEKPLMEFPSQYRTHMFKLHEIYTNKLKEGKKYINLGKTIEYVNTLHPSRQMFLMNYNLRKKVMEDKIVEKLA